jgi:DNA invertase Pin-like site-specific DNA recombinase
VKLDYAHISAADQNADPQFQALRKAGCQKLFTDHEGAGGTAKRPELDRALKVIKAGDTLVVWKLNRLARSLHGLIEIVEDLHRRRANLLSLSEAINTSTPGNLIFHTFAVLAQFERNQILERTREGMRQARARGVRTGPKPKLSREQIDHARKLIEEGERREDVANQLKVSRVTLYRALAV